ncbi:hypothetical protein ABZ883_04710 [Streptomyces sp. NPDC046977]|uniref:hypothetical protein n=1 Tax=Streptomyces sp. NPDC046977 TaxID=3154703 RepID=UPI0033E207FE
MAQYLQIPPVRRPRPLSHYRRLTAQEQRALASRVDTDGGDSPFGWTDPTPNP